MDIAFKLRKLREKNKMPVKDVIGKLNQYGYSISDKALYSYENGSRMPSADMLVVLCKIYNCKNMLEVFDDNNEVLFTNMEWEHIENYRSLDQHGKETVDSVLNIEMKRMRQLKIALSNEHDKSKESTAFRDKLQELKAAHNDFADDEEEQKLIREDLEDMENNW